MDADSTVTATFAIANTLSVDLVGNGNVSGGSGAINCGPARTSARRTSPRTPRSRSSPRRRPARPSPAGPAPAAAPRRPAPCSMNQSKSVTATFSATPTPPTAGLLAHRLRERQRHGHRSRDQLRQRRDHVLRARATPPDSTVTLTATRRRRDVRRLGRRHVHGHVTTCTVTFTRRRRVSATFTGGTSKVQLTVSVSGPGKVTGGADQLRQRLHDLQRQVAQGSTVTLTATPASGAKFAGWGGSCAGTATTCSVSMTSAERLGDLHDRRHARHADDQRRRQGDGLHDRGRVHRRRPEQDLHPALQGRRLGDARGQAVRRAVVPRLERRLLRDEDDVHGEADDGPDRDRELQLEGDRRRRARRPRRSPRSARRSCARPRPAGT